MSGKQKEYPEVEYQTITGPAYMYEANDFLNEWGKEGWECFHISEGYKTSKSVDIPDARTYVLRRTKV